MHVGAGTFKSVECENLENHKMHSEFFDIPKKHVKRLILKKDFRRRHYSNKDYRILRKNQTKPRLLRSFLHPHNPPLRQDYLLTNFHLPKSTLIMLVSAFIGRQNCLKLYDIAIKEKYRFYSYGDAMLIL